MYRAYCDNALMYDSRIEELALINPVLNLEENKAGSFSFMINQEHPFYDKIQKRKSIIDVYQDADLLFSGTCIDDGKDFYNQKNIFCEGELSFLNDSIQRPARYQGITVRGLLEAYIANHNAQVEEAKRFTVGVVTVTDPNDSLYCYTNMENTMQALKEDLVDDLGGFLRTRHENGVKYIDYLADSPNTNSQVIKIGRNLMDFTTNTDSSEIATAIIPLGAKLEESTVEGLETRLTIESVNGGFDYVYSQEAVDTYGWITKTVPWDDVTTPEALKRKGEQYLSDIQFENMVIQAKAVDLHLTDSEIERFKISDNIRVLSAPHGLDRFFRLTKCAIYLDNPAGNTITLGKDEKVTLSAKSNQASEEIKKAIESIVPSSEILKQAATNATNLIATAMGGYIVKTENELLIMDTNDTKTAKKVWRWNINGLGYSANGYAGPYELAMTMDGSIVADFIKTGTLNANLLKSGTLQDSKAQNYWNLATGEFSLASTTKVGSSTIATAKNVSDAKTSANAYADNVASTAQTNANKYADGLIQDFDESLDNVEVFNRLTDNGNIKGIILSNGQLFINADYIKSGTLSGDLIKGGTISASKILSTNAEEETQIDISGGQILTYNPSSGYRGVRIKGHQIILHSWKDADNEVGIIGSLYDEDTGNSPYMASLQDEYLTFGYKTDDTTGTIYRALTINQEKQGEIVSHNAMYFNKEAYFRQNGIECGEIRGFEAHVASGDEKWIEHNLYIRASDYVGIGRHSSSGADLIKVGQDEVSIIGTLYANGNIISSSDRDVKNSIEELEVEKATDFIYSLKPRKYKYNDGTSDRFHHGFIAQEVKEAMNNEDWGVYVDRMPGENGGKGIRYEELIADMVATIQTQNERILQLEEKLKG